MDITKIKLAEICTILPTIIIQDLNLTNEMAMELKEDQVHLKMYDSLYKNLYSTRSNLTSVNLLGCPIASAVACALTKTSGKTVTIKKHQVSPDGLAIDVWCSIMQG